MNILIKIILLLNLVVFGCSSRKGLVYKSKIAVVYYNSDKDTVSVLSKYSPELTSLEGGDIITYKGSGGVVVVSGVRRFEIIERDSSYLDID